LSAQIADNSPQVLLLSNGDTNSFALTLVREGVKRSVTLQSNPDGTIQSRRDRGAQVIGSNVDRAHGFTLIEVHGGAGDRRISAWARCSRR
jgi:hypothetical protein